MNNPTIAKPIKPQCVIGLISSHLEIQNCALPFSQLKTIPHKTATTPKTPIAKAPSTKDKAETKKTTESIKLEQGKICCLPIICFFNILSNSVIFICLDTKIKRFKILQRLLEKPARTTFVPLYCYLAKPLLSPLDRCFRALIAGVWNKGRTAPNNN